MLTVLFSWIIIGGAALLFGKAVTDGLYGKHRAMMGKPDVYIVTGLIFLNIYAQLFSLFYKIGGIACTILGVAGIVILAVWIYRHFRCGKRFVLFPGCGWEKPAVWRTTVILFCFVLTLIWTNRDPGQYDTGLYHAQAIRWIEEYGVVPGLGNLHMRLAYNSAFMSLQALFSLVWLVGRSLHSLNGFFCLMALVYAVSTVRLWGEKSLQVSDMLKCVMVVFAVQKRYDISSSGTDIWALLLIIYIFTKWNEYRESDCRDSVSYGWLCLVSVYAVTVKLSAAAMVILAFYPLYLFIKEKNGKAIFWHVVAGAGILLPFLIRNVIISGYLVYPYGSLDLFNPDWKMDKGVLLSDSLDIKMFARGLRSAAEYDTSLFGWIPGWFLRQDMEKRVLIVLGAACIPVAIRLLVRCFRKKEYAGVTVLGAGLVNLLFWFFSAPHMRYGEPYIYVLVAMVLGMSWRWIKKPLSVAMAAILLPLLVQYGMGCTGLADMESKHWVFQPYYNSWQATQYPVDNVQIWKPDEGDLSGYFAFPATPQGGQLKVLRLRGESFREGFRHE